MKKLLTLTTIALSLSSVSLFAEAAPVNTVCPISGKPANPKITLVYEGDTYAFADEENRQKFEEARTASIYQQIGGKAALAAAVELFYVKVLADDRVKHYFADINMTRQKKKQREFLSMALGAPTTYTGADLRTAHKELPGLSDKHFDAIAENLKATLEELKVKPELIARALAIVETTRADVLNRPRTSN